VRGGLSGLSCGTQGGALPSWWVKVDRQATCVLNSAYMQIAWSSGHTIEYSVKKTKDN